MMLKKITLLQSASMCWTILGPTIRKPPMMRCCSVNLGHTLPVETLVLNQCWTNVSKPTMTYCQQLQPFPNVDSTIGSYLGRAIAFKEKITKC